MLCFPCSSWLLRKPIITADRKSPGDGLALFGLRGKGVVLVFLPGEFLLLLQWLPAFPLTVSWWHVCLYAAKVVPQQITHTSPRIQSDYTAERSNLIPLSSHRASPNPVAMETRNDNRWGNSSSVNESVSGVWVMGWKCCGLKSWRRGWGLCGFELVEAVDETAELGSGPKAGIEDDLLNWCV